MKFYDNTQISAYKVCPRFYYLRHQKHWTEGGTSIPLAAGLAWHAGMDEVWKGILEGLNDRLLVDIAIDAWRQTMVESLIPIDDISYTMNEKRNSGTFKEMFTNYVKQNRSFIEQIELLGCEVPFAVPLGESEDTYYVGRRDKIFKKKERIFVGEHKTSSLYAKSGHFQAAFLNSFSPNAQIDGYAYATFLEYGKAFKSVYVDAALVHKSVHDGFKFIPIERQFSQLDAWLAETKGWTERIENEIRYLDFALSANKSPLAYFPKVDSSCFRFFRNCMYKDICRFLPHPALMKDPPKGFIIEEWKPFDVNNIASIIEGK